MSNFSPAWVCRNELSGEVNEREPEEAKMAQQVGLNAAAKGKDGKRGLVGWLLAKLGASSREPARLAVVERVSLAQRQSLALVEADGRRFLIATSGEGTPAFLPLDAAQSRPEAQQDHVQGTVEGATDQRKNQGKDQGKDQGMDRSGDDFTDRFRDRFTDQVKDRRRTFAITARNRTASRRMQATPFVAADDLSRTS
jgi:flagellar biogenesis protein FliO